MIDENKRFVNENDGDIRDTLTMIKYYCLSLTGKELCDLLNKQDHKIKNLEEQLTPKCSTCKNLFNYPEYKLKGYEKYPPYCTRRKYYIHQIDKPKSTCEFWWLDIDALKKYMGDNK